MAQHTVVILGDHDREYRPHLATREAILDAVPDRRTVINTRWLGADDLQLYPGIVAEAAAVVLAPPGPRSPRVLPEPLIPALTLVRERSLPFLATGEAHGLVFIEVARKVLGLVHAGSTRYDEETPDPVVHALPPRRSVDAPAGPWSIELEVLDEPRVRDLFPAGGRVSELTDITHGLNPDYATAIIEAGLRPAMVDPHGGRPYMHLLEGHVFHATAAFLPQLRSRPGAPHPLFRGLLQAALKAPD